MICAKQVYYSDGPESSNQLILGTDDHGASRPNGLIPLVAGAFSVQEPRGKRHSRRKYPWAFQLSVTLAKGKRARTDRQADSVDETAQPQPFKFRNR